MLTFALNRADISIETLATLAHAVAFVAAITMYLAKIPLLVLLTRAFGVKPWLKYTAGFLICSVTPATVVGPPFLLSCIQSTFYTGLVRGSVSVITDLIILILPLPIIANLHLPLNKKIGVAIIFLFGIFSITASAVSLYYQVEQGGNASEPSTNVVNALLTVTLECTIVLVISCASALGGPWIHKLKESPVVLFLSSKPRLLEAPSSNKLNSSPSSPGQPVCKCEGDTTLIHVTTDRSVQLGDAPTYTGDFSTYAVTIEHSRPH